MRSRKKAVANKTCKQMTDLIYGYINGTLRPVIKKDFERHLRVCPDCVSFLNTYEKTVAVTGVVRIDEIPAKVRKNILDFLRSAQTWAMRTFSSLSLVHGYSYPTCIHFTAPNV